MILHPGERLVAAAVLFVFATLSLASPVLRTQINQKGNFLLVGNTLAQECAAGTPPPVVGTVGNCGTNTSDSAPDVFWRADSPASGQATANITITSAQARSTAMLLIPPGAVVTHAYLYWAATLDAPGADPNVVVDRVGAGGFTQNVTAIESLQGANNSYRSVADVTALVQLEGPGAYRISGVDSAAMANVNNGNAFAAWWMVVFYRLDSDPLRSLSLYDGLDTVTSITSQTAVLNGFRVPFAGWAGTLGVVALEGDNTLAGDSLSFGGFALADAQNPAGNVFNGSHSYLGSAVSTIGDLPQTTGSPGSMSGIDLDVFDVTAQLGPSQNSATVQATSTNDVYHLATLVASISTISPLLTDSTIAGSDLNGGAVMPGDTLEYTVTVLNDGNDDATQTVFTDVMPVGTEYLPGSIEITAGANVGQKSDAAGDDQAEYDAATRRVIVRLGTGANGVSGGGLPINASTTLRFRVTISPVCSGTLQIQNSGQITAAGALSGPVTAVPDGDSNTPGSQPSTINMDVRCLTITRSGAGSGSIALTPFGQTCNADSCQQPIPAGNLIALQANANASSTFSEWTGDASGSSNPTSVDLSVDRAVDAHFLANQAITNFVATPASPVYASGGTFAVSANGGGSLQPVVYGSLTPVTCTVAGSTVSIVAAGLCSLTANQDGDVDYGAAPQVQLDVTIAQASQVISGFVSTPAAPVFVPGGTFQVSATGGASMQPIAFGSLTSTTCSVAGSTVAMLAPGLCTISANQAGDANYAAAPQVTLNVTIGPDDTIFRNGFEGS